MAAPGGSRFPICGFEPARDLSFYLCFIRTAREIETRSGQSIEHAADDRRSINVRSRLLKYFHSCCQQPGVLFQGVTDSCGDMFSAGQMVNYLFVAAGKQNPATQFDPSALLRAKGDLPKTARCCRRLPRYLRRQGALHLTGTHMTITLVKNESVLSPNFRRSPIS